MLTQFRNWQVEGRAESVSEVDLDAFAGHLRDEDVVGVTVADGHDPADDGRGCVTRQKIVPKVEKSFRTAAELLQRSFQLQASVTASLDESLKLETELCLRQRFLE